MGLAWPPTTSPLSVSLISLRGGSVPVSDPKGWSWPGRHWLQLAEDTGTSLGGGGGEGMIPWGQNRDQAQVPDGGTGR